MSNPRIPAELLDQVVDHLHDRKGAVRNCCLVSKSWIPRARQHLFANIRFDTKADLESWKETFPDPSTSPAHYAKTLHINYTHVYTAADVEAGGWIRCFSRIVHLEVYSQRLYSNESEVPLVPLHGLSPVIKSLRVKFVSLPFSRIFDLILSLPLLEDLTVGSGCYVPNKTGDGSEGPPTVVYPPNPPKFTGSLEVMMAAGVEPISRRLLSLQGGIHFRKLTLRWTSEEEMSLTSALVERCSHTLESLDIMCYIFIRPAAVDLSNATKLRDVAFRSTSLNVEWITTAFQTIPKHRGLRKISIGVPSRSIPSDVDDIKQSSFYKQWPDLDRLLVQFWESRSTRPEVICTTTEGQRRDMRAFVVCCLPELTRRGMIDLVE